MYKRIIVLIILSSLFALKLYNNSTSVMGVFDKYNISYVIENDDIKIDDFSEVLHKLNCQVVDKKYISDRLIIEGYCNEFEDFVIINGNKINFQISISEDVVIFGSPLICGSF